MKTNDARGSLQIFSHKVAVSSKHQPDNSIPVEGIKDLDGTIHIHGHSIAVSIEAIERLVAETDSENIIVSATNFVVLYETGDVDVKMVSGSELELEQIKKIEEELRIATEKVSKGKHTQLEKPAYSDGVMKSVDASGKETTLPYDEFKACTKIALSNEEIADKARELLKDSSIEQSDDINLALFIKKIVQEEHHTNCTHFLLGQAETDLMMEHNNMY